MGEAHLMQRGLPRLPARETVLGAEKPLEARRASEGWKAYLSPFLGAGGA